MQKRGQTWSVELIVSLSIFLVIIVGVLASLGARQANPVQELQSQSQQLLGRFYETESSQQQAYSFIEKNEIDDSKLSQLTTLDYSSLKSELGLSDDFCIVLVDSSNNIIPIEAPNGSRYYGVGSGSIELGSGVGCNATVS